MLVLACTGCVKNLRVDESLAGKRVRCPGCGAIVVVPLPVSLPRQASSPPVIDATTQEPPPLTPPQDPSERPTNPPFTSPDQTIDCAPGDEEAADLGKLTEFLAPSQAPDELGRLGSYRILKVLGYGGMGVVYQAEDSKLKRKVAIKAMLPNVADNRSASKRFLREAQAMAAVEHPHIARIYQVDEDRGVPFLAMEFLKGESLDTRLKRDKTLPIPEVLRIGREIAAGLAAAHESGLIHRDIKPANIWLESPKGSVKILDFGLARSETGKQNLTQSGMIVGTPSYMAPEQARGGKIDNRTDLFSLGVTLYRMSTGELPFKGTDTVSTLMAVAGDTPVSPQSLNADVPSELGDMIMKLLSKAPNDRFQSALLASEAMAVIDRDLASPGTKIAASKLREKIAAGDNMPTFAASPWVTGWVEISKGQTPGEIESLSAPEVASQIATGSQKNRRGLFSLLALTLLLVGSLLAWQFVRWETDAGTLFIDVNDPAIEVVLRPENGIIEAKTTKRSFQLQTGKGEIDFFDPETGEKLATRGYVIRGSGREVVKIHLERLVK